MENKQPNSLTRDSQDEFLTVEETCILLKVKKSKLRSMIFKNEIPVIRLGRCLRFSKGDLQLWISGKKNYSFGN